MTHPTTYTQSELKEVMQLLLRNWDRELTVSMHFLLEDKKFVKQATADNFTPENYLYYAQGDTAENYNICIDATLIEYKKECITIQQEQLQELYTSKKALPSAESILRAIRNKKRGGQSQ